MAGIAIFALLALLAGTAYMVAAHGPRFGIDLDSLLDDEGRRRKDARRGAKIFGEIRNVLQGHKQSLLTLLPARDDDSPGLGLPETDIASKGPLARMAMYVEGMVKENQVAGQALQAQLELLQELTGKYGDLYDNEQRNIESYCVLSAKLDAALNDLDRDPDSQRDHVTASLTRKMIHENDKLRARLSGCESQIEALMTDMSRLHRETRTDSLTQLPNRRAWEEKIAEPSSEQQRVFVMLDLDHFKEVNDTYGHYAGDGVLNLIATLIRNTPEVIGYRIAGDEFAMLMSSRLWDRTGYILDRLRSRVEKASLHDCGDRIQVTVSIGAAISENGEPTEDALRRADEALYVAKTEGGNRVRLHDGIDIQPAVDSAA